MAQEIYESEVGNQYKSYMPAAIAIIGALCMLGLKLQMGASFISDGALMMIALASYLLAALFQLTNLYAPSEMARKIGLWTAVAGVFFNLSSWLVRWVAAYDREIAMLRAGGSNETPWVFRYVPFANLYDLSLAFAFGAGFATLLLARKKNFQVLSALSLPLAAIILTLARFIGSEFIDLPPVLDSYWRPIHVGVASLSYGIALVCFAVAVIYLLKAGTKVESMAIWSSIFAFAVIATISKFSILTEFVYRAGLFIPSESGGKPFSAPFRFELPYVGPSLAITAAILLTTAVSFSIYHFRHSEGAKRAGRILLKFALVAQVISIALLIAAVRSTPDVGPTLKAQLEANPTQYAVAGKAIAEKQDMSAAEFSAMTALQFEQTGRQYLNLYGSKLFLSLGTNPVEFAGLLTGLAATFFVLLFSFRTDKLRERLPSLESLDNLMYKTACLAFAGLAMLLITGAIWANESWGRPWGFDSKETGALVAWLTYAGFLHSRISRGWTGKSSAYFAIVGFLLVIFTYLGVSYLLPGLHSYA